MVVWLGYIYTHTYIIYIYTQWDTMGIYIWMNDASTSPRGVTEKNCTELLRLVNYQDLSRRLVRLYMMVSSPTLLVWRIGMVSFFSNRLYMICDWWTPPRMLGMLMLLCNVFEWRKWYSKNRWNGLLKWNPEFFVGRFEGLDKSCDVFEWCLLTPSHSVSLVLACGF